MIMAFLKRKIALLAGSFGVLALQAPVWLEAMKQFAPQVADATSCWPQVRSRLLL